MIYDPKKPFTTRNRILECLSERLKNVVNGYAFRFDPYSKMKFSTLTMTGAFLFDEPISYEIEMTDPSTLRFTEYWKDGEAIKGVTFVPFDFDVPFDVLGTGYQMTIKQDEYSPIVGSKWELRLNNSNSDIRDVARWEKIAPNMSYPCAIIYPHREWKDPKVSDRYHNVLKVYITLWYEQEPGDVLWFEEFLGDCQNELLRDVHYGECLCYDFHIDEVTLVDGENSTNRVGALVECSIFYRHSDTTTRVSRN